MSNIEDLEARYLRLHGVLERAYTQSALGKGRERHGNSLPFEDQPMQTISKLIGSDSGLLFQAIKKIQESTRMDKEKVVHELLGAIVYIAGAIIFKEAQE